MINKIFEILGDKYEDEYHLMKNGKLREIYYEYSKKKSIFKKEDAFLYGIFSFLLEKYDDAIEYLLKDIENIHILDLDILYEIIGVAYLNKKNYLEATKYFILSISINPNNYASKYNLGITYLKNNNFTYAYKIFLEIQNSSFSNENIDKIIIYIKTKL